MSTGQLPRDETITFDLIQQLDQIAARSWPAEAVVEVAGWPCRRSKTSSSRRINAVLSSGGRPSPDDLSHRLERVEDWYLTNGGRSRFQVSPAAVPTDLDETLATRGYSIEAPTLVMSAPADAMDLSPDPRVSVAASPDRAWRQCFAAANPMPGEAEGRTAVIERASAQGCQTVYASGVDTAGETVAIGAMVVVTMEDGAIYPFIHNMNTVFSARRQGLGGAIIRALATTALDFAAQAVYLLVEDDNEAACRLYHHHGFRTLYGYHYRTLVPAPKVG